MVSRGLTEYLQVDLLQVHLVSAIRTQGRFGKGQGQEYTEAYVLEYWRPGFEKWLRWKSSQSKEVSESVSEVNGCAWNVDTSPFHSHINHGAQR